MKTPNLASRGTHLLCVRNATKFFSFAVAMLSAATCRADYPSEVLADGPLVYFRLNENVNAPPFDVAANSGSLGATGNGIYGGATHGAAGAIASQPSSTAASFAASGEIVVPFQAGFNVATPFSVEVWAKPADFGTTRCVMSSIKVGNSGWLFYNSLTAGQWTFRTINSSSANQNVTGGTVTVGAWHHLVGVWDGSVTHLYVNGTEVSSVSAPTFLPVSDTTISLTIGGRSDNAFLFSGSVDEPAYYGAALSAAQVLAHYQAGTNASPSTPYNQVVTSDSAVGYWRLNEPAPIFPVATNTGTLGVAANGIYQGGVTNFAGPVPTSYPGFTANNNAISVDGSSGYIRFPSSGNLTNGFLTNVTEATFLCWVKRNGAQGGYKGLLAFRPSSTGLYLNGDDTLNYGWNDASDTWGYNSTLIPPDGEWTMAAVVVRPGSATFYMGSISGGWTTAINAVTHGIGNFTTGPFAIGQDIGVGGRFFNGGIDEAAVYNKALSGGRLQSLFYTAIASNAPPVMVTDPPILSPAGTIYSTTTFQLAADVSGALPMTFQWRTNGTAIPGATSSIYTRNNASVGDSGNYDVVVTNSYGAVTSLVVAVTVNPAVPPTITTQPASRSVYVGGTASFSVGADGTTPFTYQWKHAGTNLPGETSATLILANCGTAQAGTYTVGVTNVAGGVLSFSATLTLISPAAGTFEQAILASGPIAYWRLHESSGTTAFDFVGGNDATYFNVTQGQPGAIAGDTAAGFDGSSSYVGTGKPLLNNRSEFTVMGWVKRSATHSTRGGYFGQNNVLEFGDAGGGTSIEAWLEAPQNNIVVRYPWADDQWGLIALTANGTNAMLYLDGQLVGTMVTTVTNFGANTFAFNIGGGGIFNATGDYFQGLIDDVAIFPRALSGGEICGLYLAGTAKSFRVNISQNGNLVRDTRPSGTPNHGLDFGAAWAASNTDAATVPVTRNGVMQFVAAEGDQITVPANTNLNSTTGTIMFWMRSLGITGAGNEGAMLFDRRTTAGNVFVQYGDGTLFVQASGGGNSFHSAGTVSDDTWHHVAFVYNQDGVSGGVGIYIDGVADSTNANGGSWSWPATQQIELGTSHDGWWYKYEGFLDDVRIYNRILSASEVVSAKSGGIVDAAALAGRYNFDGPPTGVVFSCPCGVLQSSPTVAPPAPWSDISGGGATEVVLPDDAAQKFYRGRH